MKHFFHLCLAGLLCVRVSAGSADATCKIRIVPADPSGTWGIASRAFETRMAKLPSYERDCREAIVEVQQKGALVSVTTSDGRRASRPVADPSDLDAVLSALLITVPVANPPSDAAPRSSPPAPIVRLDEPAKDTVELSSIAGASSSTPVWRIGAFGGGRVVWGGTYVSPAIGGSTSLAFRSFELGAFGSRELSYVTPSGSAPTGFQLSSTTAGAWGGLNGVVGPLAVTGGAWLGGAWVREQITTPAREGESAGSQTGDNVDEVPAQTISSSCFEGRIGGFASVAFPARAKLRLRSQIGLDGALFRLGDGIPTGFPLSPLPRLGTTLSVGLEGSVL